MSSSELHSLDDYQQFVTNTIKPWTREKRIALAAAMAKRWLPVYKSFSEEEEWGGPVDSSTCSRGRLELRSR